MPERPDRGRAAGQCDVGIELGHCFQSAHGLHGDGEEAEYRHDYDFAGNLKAEPNQEQRGDGNQRHGLCGGKQRIERRVERVRAVQCDADHNAEEHGEQEADHALIAGDCRGRAERVPCFDGGGENLAWRGDHRGGDMS